MSEVPRTFTPHPHQREGLDFLRNVQRPALWMPMGGGKSITTLSALLDLDYCEDIFPALVLAPLRVANGTWVREVEKWEHTKHLRVSAIAARRNPKTSATETERSAALRAPADIYTIPYGSLTWLVDKLGADWPFRTVIADESTRLKNFRIRQGAKNPRALGKVAHSKVNRFINLTGTPGSNGLKDLWGPAWFQDKGDRLGRTYSAFEQRWFRKGYDGYSLEPMEHTEREIHAKLRDICLTVRGLEVAEPIRNIIDVELEPGVRQHYRSMEKNFWADIGENGVEAANAAVKAGKCLAEGTEVLTDRGWRPIEHVSANDLLWDGEEWVTNAGSVCNGVLYVVACWGVQMTPDHKVLTTCGWRSAEEIIRGESSDRPYRPDIRLPHRYPSRGQYPHEGNQRQSYVAGALCMRPRNRGNKSELAKEEQTPLEVVWVSPRRDVDPGSPNARHDQPPSMGVMARIAKTLHKSARQRLEKLRGTRDRGLRTMDGVLREFLGGYGAYVSGREDHRADGQQRELHARELSVANSAETTEQYPFEHAHTHPFGPSDRQTGSTSLRSISGHCLQPPAQRLAGKSASGSASATRVYDILNAGPRHRFTVRGVGGATFIAHNCLQITGGNIFTDENGSYEAIHDLKLDALESVVEEAAGTPVFVSYNFQPELERILKRFPGARHLDADPKTEDDWNAGRIPMLVAHPASAGHGLNLQDGGNILVFYGIGWDLELHDQIIERIGPQRQKQSGYDRNVYIHYILASGTIDEIVFERLRSKRSVREVLLEAMERSR